MPVEPIPCPPGGGQPGPSCCSPSITSTALCLTDGTTILVVLRSPCACDGTPAGDPQVVGWLNPATGVLTPGAAPADAGPCGAGGCASVTMLRLCDYQPDGSSAQFLRHFVHDCETGQVIEHDDTELDGVSPYTPTGEVAECGQCHPTPMCAQLVGLSGPDRWVMPDGTESVAVTVVCGPISITDCAGNTTVVNECGTGFQWAAPAGDCQPGRLCIPFVVDVPEGAAVYINYLSPCDQGDVS